MSSTLQRWEYAFISKPLDYLLIGDLNELGRDGWEVISVSYDKDLKGNWSWTAFLKRPLTETGESYSQTSGLAVTSAPSKPASPTSGAAPTTLQGFELPDGDFDFREEDKDPPPEPKPEEKARSPKRTAGEEGNHERVIRSLFFRSSPPASHPIGESDLAFQDGERG